MAKTDITSIESDNLTELGFHRKRLERVADRLEADIEAGRCHGTSMIVARHGNIVLNLTKESLK